MKAEETLPTLLSLLDYEAGKFNSAEAQLKNKLPGWAAAAGSLQLKSILEKYLELVQQHIKKLNGFCSREKFSYAGVMNRIMQAFIQESDERLEVCACPNVKDVCLLACVQNINHYKISVYGTAAAFAEHLDMYDAVSIFRDLEIDEKQINHRLSRLAHQNMNAKVKTLVWPPKAIHSVNFLL
jgi:ferritin-like metal-binding protein YciE